MSEWKNVGGLWEKESKNGEVYFSGSLNGQRFVAMFNNYKTEDKHPDFTIRMKDEDSVSDERQVRREPPKSYKARMSQSHQPEDGDVPF